MVPEANPSRPDLFSARRVLCIQPHYDDNDLFAGGTIAALHDQGVEIIYLTVTDDLVGVLDQTLSDAQMTARLRAEQDAAGKLIGVDRQYWLGYPDAGSHDYYRLRADLMRHIRLVRPDFILTVDPWLPYEIHQDHILTGRAASEAAFLAGFPRLKTDPEADRDYDASALKGIVYCNTHSPNLTVDISLTCGRKHAALQAYQSQFSQADLAALQAEIEVNEREAAGCSFERAEALKVVRLAELHGNTRTWRS